MWEQVTIAELTQQRAVCYGVLKPGERQIDGVPLVRVTDINKNVVDTSSIYRITESLSNEFKRSILNGNEVLISVQGTVGCVALCTPQLKGANVSRTIAIIDADERINRAFLRYWLLSVRDKLPKQGATRASLNIADIRKLEVPLPPLAEQKRIVAQLDAAFAEIDKLIINNEKNLKNSRRIYQYAIDSYFEKNSKNNKIIKNFSKINYGHTAKSSFKKGSYKFLRITDIQEGEVNWESVPYCEVEENKLQNVLLHDGDIVFARTGATTGKSYLLKNPKNAVFASYLIRLSVNKNKLLPKYVYHYFQSKNYWEQINKGISGAAQGGFNASKLGSLQIPIIEMKEQTELTLKLDKIFYEAFSLMRLYQKKIELLVSLKSSILLKKLNNKAA